MASDAGEAGDAGDEVPGADGGRGAGDRRRRRACGRPPAAPCSPALRRRLRRQQALGPVPHAVVAELADGAVLEREHDGDEAGEPLEVVDRRQPLAQRLGRAQRPDERRPARRPGRSPRSPRRRRRARAGRRRRPAAGLGDDVLGQAVEQRHDEVLVGEHGAGTRHDDESQARLGDDGEARSAVPGGVELEELGGPQRGEQRRLGRRRDRLGQVGRRRGSSSRRLPASTGRPARRARRRRPARCRGVGPARPAAGSGSSMPSWSDIGQVGDLGLVVEHEALGEPEDAAELGAGGDDGVAGRRAPTSSSTPRTASTSTGTPSRWPATSWPSALLAELLLGRGGRATRCSRLGVLGLRGPRSGARWR